MSLKIARMDGKIVFVSVMSPERRLQQCANSRNVYERSMLKPTLHIVGWHREQKNSNNDSDIYTSTCTVSSNNSDGGNSCVYLIYG